MADLIDGSRVRLARALNSYRVDRVRLETQDLAGFTHVVATRKALFLVSSDSFPAFQPPVARAALWPVLRGGEAVIRVPTLPPAAEAALQRESTYGTAEAVPSIEQRLIRPSLAKGVALSATPGEKTFRRPSVA